MRLISVTVRGLGRFEASNEMRIARKVVAVVGPNEAGKTSLLRALSRITSGGAFTRAELTRYSSPPDDLQPVTARFILDEEDKSALTDVPNSAGIRWFTAGRRLDGQIVTGVTPRPGRDATARRATQAKVPQLPRGATTQSDATQPDASEDVAGDGIIQEDDAARVDEILGGTSDSIPANEIATMREIGGRLLTSNNAAIREFGEELRHLADIEEEEHPFDTARRLLYSRSPAFVLFEGVGGFAPHAP